MKHILFFATKDDLLSMITLVERNGSLRYVQMGNFLSSEVEARFNILETGAELPCLGKASADSSAACEAFLVCDPNTTINLRTVEGSDVERVCVDQFFNPDSVEFKPGGIWGDDILLYGRVGTASESQASQALMKRFQAAIRKSFLKIKSYYVGPQAMTLLESGKRLTIAAQSPKQFDLTLT